VTVADRRSTATRYPAKMAARACELRIAGWTIPQIERLLVDEFGSCPSETTIRKWTDPGFHERVTAAQRERRRRRESATHSGRFPSNFTTFTDEFKWARVRSLRGLGVSYEAIARVMSFDFREAWDANHIRYRLTREAS
jgi:hypothetical protein